MDSLDDCGACGASCARANATASCAGDSCHIDSCDAGFDSCDGEDSTGCENSLDSTSDCGACGTPCSRLNATASCQDEVCQIEICSLGFDDCDGVDFNGCEDAMGTVDDCLACDDTCALNQYCDASGCLDCVEDSRCGDGCINCAAQVTNMVCHDFGLYFECGCDQPADCPGAGCSANHCCVENNLCGNACDDCSAPLINQACVYLASAYACGCVNDGDCGGVGSCIDGQCS